MKHLVLTILVVCMAGIVACKKSEQPKQTKQSLKELPAGVHAVKVLDRIDASSYSYIEVSENGNSYWIAAPQIKASKGDELYYSQSMEMKNFHSKTLDRTFDKILFVQDISKSPSVSTATSSHSSVNNEPEESIKVKPAKNGNTVAEIFSDKNNLSGKEVTVRGKVTKYNANIMGRNWIHIQDGTSSAGNYDLLITSNETAAVGETITATGKVATDKDFGAGYKYPVMIENAKIKTK